MQDTTILFDLDGTVIDSTEAIIECFSHAFAINGHPAPKSEEVVRLIGYPLDKMFQMLGIAAESSLDYVKPYKELYRQVGPEKTRLLPNVESALQKASQFARLAVVTTKTARFSKEILERLGVGHYFATLVGFEDVHNAKPHPEPLLLALLRLQAKPQESYMIGDTWLDIEAARAAKVTPLAVTSGYEPRERLAEECELIFDDILGAVDYLATEHGVGR